MEIPKTPACVAPQVFHGTKGDVTVAVSSNVRLKFSGDNPTMFQCISASLGMSVNMFVA